MDSTHIRYWNISQSHKRDTSCGIKGMTTWTCWNFNNSPLAKWEGLQFIPDNFVYHLIGTSGDHAADQKKSHEILHVWQMEVILQCLGEESLFQMDVNWLLSILAPLKINQINQLGGQEAWDILSNDDKAKTDIKIIKEVGKKVFDKLPEDEQQKLTLFIRTGCCMHKDLNCVKGGDKAMQEHQTQVELN